MRKLEMGSSQGSQVHLSLVEETTLGR